VLCVCMCVCACVRGVCVCVCMYNAYVFVYIVRVCCMQLQCRVCLSCPRHFLSENSLAGGGNNVGARYCCIGGQWCHSLQAGLSEDDIGGCCHASHQSVAQDQKNGVTEQLRVRSEPDCHDTFLQHAVNEQRACREKG